MAKFLVVDDSSVQLKAMCMVIENSGHQTDQATNGQEAIEIACTEPYDFVFMDHEMPIMDGLEAATKLKEKLGNKCPPLVVVSASCHEENADLFTKSGFDYALNKPFGPDELNEFLSKFSI